MTTYQALIVDILLTSIAVPFVACCAAAVIFIYVCVRDFIVEEF